MVEDYLYVALGNRKPSLAFVVGRNWKENMLHYCRTGKTANLEVGLPTVDLLGKLQILHRECPHCALK